VTDTNVVSLDRLTITRLDLPLERRFATARSTSTHRSVVILEAEHDGLTGLGEAAPYPGHTADDVKHAWSSLVAAGPSIVEHPAGRHPLTLTAAAALDQALTDLAAQAAGKPLWRYLGGTSPRVKAGWVAAAGGHAEETLAAVARGEQAGHRAVKVKIVPGTAHHTLAAVAASFGHLSIGADANGAFVSGADAELRSLDDLDLTYLEQPLPPAASEEIAALAGTLATPVALDESVPDESALDAAVAGRWAPILVVKAGHLGTWRAASALARIRGAGMLARIGGLVETAVGRAHALALATLVPDGPPPDLAAGSPYFVAEPAPGITLEAGYATASEAPGLGVTIDRSIMARLQTEQARFG
jgi:O-succinylbenzoate synthase